MEFECGFLGKEMMWYCYWHKELKYISTFIYFFFYRIIIIILIKKKKIIITIIKLHLMKFFVNDTSLSACWHPLSKPNFFYSVDF